MDFLNRAYAQLADLFRSMTPGARISAALLLIVTVVSVAYLFNSQVSGPDGYLMGGEMFSAGQLRDMTAAFGKANLEAQVDGARIKIPRGQESKYMAALAEANALPMEFGDYLKKAAGVSSWTTNRVQQEAGMKIATCNELQNILNHFVGVEKCAVHIDEEVKRGFRDKSTGTASVSIVPRGSQPFDETRIPAIKYLVASSVAGLKPENVTVIDLSTGLPYPGTGNSGGKGGGMMGEYTELKKHHEREFQQKIKNELLAYIPGVRVTTSVELDPTILNEENSTEYDAKAVVFDSRETTGLRIIEGPPPAGRPGLAAQGGVANQSAVVGAGGGTKNNDETSQSEQRKAVPTTQKRIVHQGLTPKRVTVSVAVPNTYYEEIWHKQNPTAEGEPEKKPDAAALGDLQTLEKKKIEDLIVTLLPIRDKTADPYPQVTVSTFFPISAPPVPDATLQENALAWMGQNGRTLGMTGLALVSLIMLRSMVRSVPTSPGPTTPAGAMETPSTLSLVAEDEPDEPTDSSARGRLKRRAVSGPSLRDELADIVKEDPEAAVSILRTWIGNAS